MNEIPEPTAQPGPPYSLEGLASLSGFPQRRIRSWIAEGLLPAPRARGRAAFYGDEHLDRLLFIRRIQEKLGGSRVPHGLVREAFHSLEGSGDPDVVRRVARGEQDLPLSELLSASSAFPPVECLASAIEPEALAPVPSVPRPVRAPKAPWTTIEIRDGLELRLRGDDPERVAWLARMARRLREWADE
jgi:hypothetical protein